MTIVDFLIDLVMTPGASIRLIPAINVTLVALLGLLLYLGQDWAIEMHHLYTMTGLAIALLISVNWFLIEFKAEQERQEKQKKRPRMTTLMPPTKQDRKDYAAELIEKNRYIMKSKICESL